MGYVQFRACPKKYRILKFLVQFAHFLQLIYHKVQGAGRTAYKPCSFITAHFPVFIANNNIKIVFGDIFDRSAEFTPRAFAAAMPSACR